jgi:uncharacterized protein YndB with AHSA1/START domain
MEEQTASRDAVVIERTFDAPIGVIWQMWTVPEHFAAWYGPDGVTVLPRVMDVRVGGRRLIGMEMQSPDGPRRMWFAGEYVDVVEQERLVYTDYTSDEDGTPLGDTGGGHPQVTKVRVEVTQIAGRTRMVMTHAGIPSDSPGAVGWAMAFDKLAHRVAEL